MLVYRFSVIAATMVAALGLSSGCASIKSGLGFGDTRAPAVPAVPAAAKKTAVPAAAPQPSDPKKPTVAPTSPAAAKPPSDPKKPTVAPTSPAAAKPAKTAKSTKPGLLAENKRADGDAPKAAPAVIEEKDEEDNGPDPVPAGNQALDNILKGMENDDYFLFSKNFTVEMVRKFPQTNFKEINGALKLSLGKYISRQYLGELNWGGLRVLLWKARFSVPKNDVLIMVQLGYVDDRYSLFSFSFQGQANLFAKPQNQEEE